MKAILKIVAAVAVFSFVVVPVGLRLAGQMALLPVSVAVGTAYSVLFLVLCIGLLVALAVRAAGWKRVLIGTVALTLVTGVIWVSSTIVWRDDQYRHVTAEFKAAAPFPKRADLSGGGSGWDESIKIASAVRADLTARDHLDIATIRYSDEGAPRQLFPPADYTNISDIRWRGDKVYILRSITLFQTEWRLTVFDVDRRVVVGDRRVDADDVR